MLCCDVATIPVPVPVPTEDSVLQIWLLLSVVDGDEGMEVAVVVTEDEATAERRKTLGEEEASTPQEVPSVEETPSTC